MFEKRLGGGETNTDCTDITDFIRDGTVFQTALPSLLVIPRLRPGLLSLRSVLSSRQNLLPTTNMEFSAGWKPVPSVSESNPGRSLGIYNHEENCCLEDSTSHRAKHPRQSDKSVFEKNREVKRTRIERIQRILSGGDTRSTSEASASIR